MSTVIAAIIPCKNEVRTLPRVLASLLQVPVDIIIPVINGTTDGSLEVIKRWKGNRVYPVCFSEPLGIDIPRAVGAKVALYLKALIIVFIDGDMCGDIGKNIKQLVESIFHKHLDLALTNCYPDSQPAYISPLAAEILKARKYLNNELSLTHIGAATPSHGPHAISSKLLKLAPVEFFAVPPTLLSFAAQNGLRVDIGTTIPHSALGSPLKDAVHSNLIAETIIGDCMEALQLFRNLPRHRYWKNKIYIGYNNSRRWDLLNKYVIGNLQTDCN